MKRVLFLSASLVLIGAVALPIVFASAQPFVVHMLGHMMIVVVASPLLVLAAPGAFRTLNLSPLLAAVIEFVVVWGWHLPALHLAARASAPVFLLEQSLFLGAGLAVWASALTAREPLAGALALFLTAMHMTALGALLILASQDLYGGGVAAQQIGGMLMLGLGSSVSMFAALWLAARGLARSSAAGGSS